jgi:hypothetical protein
MAKAPSEKLYVNLSASQVRKLLKGRGFGVRRVESAGGSQSIVIHTATGQHRRDLKSLLADPTLGTAATATPVNELRNLGPVSSQWLRAVGIKTGGDLHKCGPVVAFRLVKQKYPKASLNLLWAMAGALKDQDWRDLSAKERKRLLAELECD